MCVRKIWVVAMIFFYVLKKIVRSLKFAFFVAKFLNTAPKAEIFEKLNPEARKKLFHPGLLRDIQHMTYDI